jgi:hypothetical protein
VTAGAKLAPTLTLAFIVTVRVEAVPEQAPAHPAKVEPEAGVAMRVTTVPALLDWLSDNQEKIEKKLFNARHETPPSLFLYDVTSSYLEGEQNELANYGYNRDKKRGKKQIVIGLLTDPFGDPIAVRVFEGNTIDSKTVEEQIETLTRSFGVTEVILVGDRGMLKKPQIESLPEGFRYITAITKPQIRTLLERVYSRWSSSRTPWPKSSMRTSAIS